MRVAKSKVNPLAQAVEVGFSSAIAFLVMKGTIDDEVSGAIAQLAAEATRHYAKQFGITHEMEAWAKEQEAQVTHELEQMGSAHTTVLH